jgi:hypothetical protein
MALPVTFATLAAGNQQLSLFDTEFAAVAALGLIPCAASAGPNNVALTPFASVAPAVTSYPDLGPSFVFAAAATSTGAVTLNVSGVGARNAYKWNGSAPMGAGDLIAGSVYKVTPLAALNAGSGGFVVDSIGAQNSFADVEFVIDGGGSAITTGAKGSIRIPWAATILTWSVIADQSGSIAVDILRANAAVPSVSMVGGGNKPTLSAAQLANAIAPSGWTSVVFAANDFITFSVSSAATVTRVTVDLSLSKS